MTTMTGELKVNLEFSGGAELLVGKIKRHSLSLPQEDEPWTIRRLLVWIKDNILKERPELFLQGDTVRPGILVLVNDSDWELLITVMLLMPKSLLGIHHHPFYQSDELDYKIQSGDSILFISTLHGG